MGEDSDENRDNLHFGPDGEQHPSAGRGQVANGSVHRWVWKVLMLRGLRCNAAHPALI